jgi:hypothetical protein
VQSQTIKYQKKWTQRSVLSQPKGFRPAPEIYLKHSYIKAFLKKFNHGGSFIITADMLAKSAAEVIGLSGGQLIYTKNQMDDILEKAHGKIAEIEKELMVKHGTFANKSIIRIDISKPKKFHIRVPTGNEAGTVDIWIPGGQLPNGLLQAVIDPVPKNSITQTRIN